MPSFGITIIGANKVLSSINKLVQSQPNLFQQAVTAACIVVEAEAKKLIRGGYSPPPFDTGTMRNSIGHQIETSKSASGEIYGKVGVGVSVHYGIYVHEGTSRMAARPFLSDAAENVKGQINVIFEMAVKKSFYIFGGQ